MAENAFSLGKLSCNLFRAGKSSKTNRVESAPVMYDEVSSNIVMKYDSEYSLISLRELFTKKIITVKVMRRDHQCSCLNYCCDDFVAVSPSSSLFLRLTRCGRLVFHDLSASVVVDDIPCYLLQNCMY